ncbi:MAG TPA: response regulator transcription factor [Oligoflexia bacterium]|nr:response regulator transcription factor [Oligoflexia bacterium]
MNQETGHLGAVVYIVDDDASVRRSLTRLLQASGFLVEAFANADEFLAKREHAACGCLVLDVAMPGLNGLELQEKLAAVENIMPIIFITGHGDVPMSVRAMKAGAVDFLTKPFDEKDLLQAVAVAIERGRSTQADAARKQAVKSRAARLSPREREVLAHIISGKLNKQIAADIGTVEKTVKVHRSRIMKKMEAKSIAELVRLAEQAGIKPC